MTVSQAEVPGNLRAHGLFFFFKVFICLVVACRICFPDQESNQATGIGNAGVLATGLLRKSLRDFFFLHPICEKHLKFFQPRQEWLSPSHHLCT